MTDVDRHNRTRSLDEDGLDMLLEVLRESTQVQPPAGLAASLRAATVLSANPWPRRLALAGAALVAWLLLSLAAPLAASVIAAVAAVWWLAPAAGLVFLATRTSPGDVR